MTLTLPPMSSGALRLLIHITDDAVKGETIYADIYPSKLPELLTLVETEGAASIDRPAMIKGSDAGAVTARQIFARVLEGPHDGSGAAVLPAVWISLYGDPYIPGAGLHLDDLLAATDSVMKITVSTDFSRWTYRLTTKDGPICGKKDVPLLH